MHNKTFSVNVILKDNISNFYSNTSISAQVFRVQTLQPCLCRSLILIIHNWRALFLFAPLWHFESCNNQVEPNDSVQGKCCSCRTRSPNGSNLASPWADYHPFFRQGAGGRYCCAERQRTLGNLRHHRQQQQRSVIRQLQGWGAPRHTALLVDKTSWKERTAYSWGKF